MPARRFAPCAALLALLSVPASAQTLATRAAILQAEDRRAQKPADLATIRSGARSGDGNTARIGLRALGRLERPALITDILPGLRHRLPEVRAEAANAVAQAAQGAKAPGAPAYALGPAQTALITRLGVEAEPSVRAALCESLGRLPYTVAADAARAEQTLTDFAARTSNTTDRLGIAKGLEAFVRLHRTLSPPRPATVDLLRAFARPTPERSEADLLRDARIRRLAVEALVTADAADLPTLTAASHDPDPQVRRLAVRGATTAAADTLVANGLIDASPLVRIEALRTARLRSSTDVCGPAITASEDEDMKVALVAIDQLAGCGQVDRAVAVLTSHVADLADAEAPRNWHRAAHALLALGTAAPAVAGEKLPAFAAAKTWQLRVYAARTAAVLGRRDILNTLARDPYDNVVEAAIVALRTTVDHAADPVYIAALSREGYQVIRVAALALEGSPSAAAAVDPLKRALEQAEDDGRPGAADARAALRTALASLGAPARTPKPGTQAAAPITADDLRKLAAPRARISIRDVGVFDVALFTTEAPATVFRFIQLARAGYYDGLTFHRVVPNGIIQGGSPDANEYISDAPYMRDEVGLWPHVRGAVGISTRGRDTGDAQIFVDLVDNPRYDHTYTVFAQVLNGMDIVDRILEGDVIDTVEIVP